MKFSETNKNIFTALIKARKLMQHPNKNQTNPFFKSDYADQKEVFNSVYPALLDNDLSLTLEPNNIISQEKKIVYITPTLVHISGEWIQYDTLSLPITKTDAHAVAGAWTYLSRYTLSLIFGLSASDGDADGNDTYTEEEQNKMNKYKKGTPQ